MGGVGTFRGVMPRRPHRRARLLPPTLVLLALVVSAAVAAPSARANGTLTVTTVDQATSAALSGIDMQITPWNENPAYVPPSYGTTDGSGTATLSLPAGKYILRVEDPNHIYATQWWNQRTYWDKADPIVVADNQTASCQVGMPIGGHVAGTVTDAQGAPLAGMSVDVDPADPYVLDGGGETTTDASGHYDVGGLPTGAYVVECQDFITFKYLYQFYPDQRSYVTATPFDVVAGETTAGPTVQMKQAATISGSLTTHLGVVPHDVMCGVDRRNADGTWDHEYAGADCNNNETYDIGQLAPGHYRLWFQWEVEPNPTNLPQYYKDTYWPDQAVQFDLAEGEHLTGMDAVIWGDNGPPVPEAPDAAVVERGAVAGLRYAVKDTGRHGPTADVTIKIKTLAGKTVKVIRLPRRSVNHWHLCRYTCVLPKGKYRFCVFAIDSGGNRQKRIASNRLIVR